MSVEANVPVGRDVPSDPATCPHEILDGLGFGHDGERPERLFIEFTCLTCGAVFERDMDWPKPGLAEVVTIRELA